MLFLRLTSFQKVLLLFGFCSLLSLIPLISLHPKLQLRLEMAVETQGISPAQVYFDTGKGFNEAESLIFPVDSRSLQDFRQVTFMLPAAPVVRLRFDPFRTAGRFAIRNVEIFRAGRLYRSFRPEEIKEFHDITSRVQQGSTIVFGTPAGAGDAGIALVLQSPLRSRPGFAFNKVRQTLVVNALLLLLAIVALVSQRVSNPAAVLLLLPGRLNRRFEVIASRLTSDDFLTIDAKAVWFYAACLICFVMAVTADLNGSSSGLYSTNYGQGVREKHYIGAPRNIRSDEWGYSTPDVLNQALRTDRFAVENSDLGGHSVALTGNVPVWHFTAFFRPQFWAFFLLPADYGFSFFWQSKALLLVGGLFTWLLLLTRSTLWSATGALWFFFSPFMQWSYSWPSALPEMIGLGCLATVCFCYLTIGRSLAGLLVAGLGAMACSVDFAMCTYVPHLIPLVWVNVFVFAAWCVSRRKLIISPEGLGLRFGVLALAIAGTAAVGLGVYRDLQVAIQGISDTSYPGRRIVAGGTMPPWLFATHFLLWTTVEDPFPVALGNISEGSGFLWLAPVALLCISPVKIRGFQRSALLLLCAIAGILFIWLAYPISANVGGLMFLNRCLGARLLPGLGLANVAIVSLCMTGRSRLLRFGESGWPRELLLCAVVLVGMFVWLRSIDARLNYFFSIDAVLIGSGIAAVLTTLMVSGRRRLLAVVLVGSHALAFGTVNPVKRGLKVFLDSDLYHFVHSNPSYTRDKWMIYSNVMIRSGFFAAAGCEIFTGTHYLPDVDHFALFRARGLDLKLFNRLGYIIANPVAKPASEALTLPHITIVEWDVLPQDPILRQIGIRYAAFDGKPAPGVVSQLKPLADRSIDGFWLYELPGENLGSRLPPPLPARSRF